MNYSNQKQEMLLELLAQNVDTFLLLPCMMFINVSVDGCFVKGK